MKFLKILIAGILVIGFLGVSCQKTSEKQTVAPTNDFLSQENTKVSSRTSENLSKAKTQASVWKNDAQFVAYNFKVPPDMNPASLSETFVFGSSQDSANWWTFSIDSTGKFIRALIPKEDYLGENLQPIQEQFLKKNYLEALKAAEAMGGLDFRAKNPEAEITMTLTQGQPKNWLWWVVEYRGAKETLKIRYSVSEGKIYDDQGNPKTSTK